MKDRRKTTHLGDAKRPLVSLLSWGWQPTWRGVRNEALGQSIAGHRPDRGSRDGARSRHLAPRRGRSRADRRPATVLYLPRPHGVGAPGVGDLVLALRSARGARGLTRLEGQGVGDVPLDRLAHGLLVAPRQPAHQ